MKLVHGLLLGLYSVQANKTQDEDYNGSIESCKLFAKKFDNTCEPDDEGNYSQTSLDQVQKRDVKCTGAYGVCPTSGTETVIDEEKETKLCVFQRQLCVQCYDLNGVTKIRVQSNGLPSTCYRSEIAPNTTSVDFTVNWMQQTDNTKSFGQMKLPETVDEDGEPIDEDDQQAENQETLNSIVCNSTMSDDIRLPQEVGYQNNGDVLNHTWGLATTGVVLANGLNKNGVDRFQPAPYGWVFEHSWWTDLFFIPDTNNKQYVDWCLAYPNEEVDEEDPSYGVMQYYSASTCAATRKYLPTKVGPMDQNITNVTINAFKENLPFRSAFGVSKDGRPIYTPLHGGGKTYGDCEVDICNGIHLWGNYAYVTTMFHPYIMGCYGPGSSPENLNQQCSANPRGCNMVEPPAWYEWGSDEDGDEPPEEMVEEGSQYGLTASVMAVISMMGLTLF